MTKSSTSTGAGHRLCPTCGTRVGAAATKCLVCGADLTGVSAATGATGPTKPVSAASSRAARRAAQGSSLAARPISLGAVLVIVVLSALIIVGGGFIAVASGAMDNPFIQPTETPTATITLQPTATDTPTPTETPWPTATPLPPTPYKIVAGDSCIKIAVDFNVSVQSIVDANPGVIDVNCNILPVGSVIQVPQPTPTMTPLPTSTLAIGPTPIPRTTYTVQPGDTLAGIARFYGLNITDLMEANGLADPNSVQAGKILVIPLEKAVKPGPTPTPTAPPPYPAPNLLLPADGFVFKAGDIITLQWVTVGELRPGETYQVTLEDVTCNCARVWHPIVSDTTFILPAEYQPQGGGISQYRWSVTPVRQRSAEGGQAAYDSAGLASPVRSFVWVGSSAPAPTP